MEQRISLRRQGGRKAALFHVEQSFLIPKMRFVTAMEGEEGLTIPDIDGERLLGPPEAVSKPAPGISKDEKKARTKERQVRAAALHIQGKPKNQIAEILGVTPTAAAKMIDRELEEQRTESPEQVTKLRQVAHLRLEKLVQWLYYAAAPKKPGDNPNFSAIDKLVRVIETDSRLMGYQQPQRLQVDVNMIQAQIGVYVEAIMKVIPEEAIARVHTAIAEAQKNIQDQQAIKAKHLIDIDAAPSVGDLDEEAA